MSDVRLEILTGLGLTNNEAIVYLANLELGPTTVIKMSKKTGLPRGSIYSVLGSLRHRGLVSTQPKGAKHVFVAESPDHLEKLLQQKKTMLQSILPDLFSMHMHLENKDTLIKHFQGLEGIKTALDNLLKLYTPGDYYYVITDQEKWYELDPIYARTFLGKRKEIQSQPKMILQDNTFAREYIDTKISRNEQAKILTNEYQFEADLIITPKIIAVSQTVHPLNTLTIENEAIIGVCRQMFELVWASLPDES